MSTNLATGQVIETKVFCVLGEQISVNVRHWSPASVGASPSTDVDFSVGFAAAAKAAYPGILSENAQFYASTVQIIRPSAFLALGTRDVTQGTRDGDALPSQVAGLLKLTTSKAGRAFRGRVYLPFPSEEDNDPTGRPGATYITNATTFSQLYTQVINISIGGRTAVVAPVIYHRGAGNVDLVTGSVTRLFWATQRRRSRINQPDRLPG